MDINNHTGCEHDRKGQQMQINKKKASRMINNILFKSDFLHSSFSFLHFLVLARKLATRARDVL